MLSYRWNKICAKYIKEFYCNDVYRNKLSNHSESCWNEWFRNLNGNFSFKDQTTIKLDCENFTVGWSYIVVCCGFVVGFVIVFSFGITSIRESASARTHTHNTLKHMNCLPYCHISLFLSFSSYFPSFRLTVSNL